MDLIPIPDLPGAHVVVELSPTPTPFGTSVSVDGSPQYDLTFRIRGLPPVASFGRYTAYVAWVTTPNLRPEYRLGEVRNGLNRVGRVALNNFLIVITAEVSPAVKERHGKIVLRGLSPATYVHPHDASRLPAQARSSEHTHHVPGEWVMPPMHRLVPAMIPGLEVLRPSVAAMLPGEGIDPASLPEAVPRQPIALHNGDTLALEAGLVRRRIRDQTLVMYAFNGQYPGPLIHAPQGATVTVNFVNRLDQPTSVHWHGLRLDNRFDGVPGLTQDLIPPGGQFWYQLHFPDVGIYWYHPHFRADMQQDLGLYGSLLVHSPRRDYYAPADHEEILMLDDLLLGEDGLVPYGREAVSHAFMGRFGNVFLVNGETEYRLAVRQGDVVRFFLTNTSNTRVFNLSLPRVRLKLVASDVGKFERERWVDNVVIAPAERYIIEARFAEPGEVWLLNRVQGINGAAGAFFSEVDTLGRIGVAPSSVANTSTKGFVHLRTNPEVIRDIGRYRKYFNRPPDHELFLTVRTSGLPFALEQVLRLDTSYVAPVEMSGAMPMMDWLSSGKEVQWVLRDPATGRENMAIDWAFRVGDVVKLRLRNDRHTLHPMAHPVHLHGQRFLVLARNGIRNENLVWKDTVLVPVGGTTDLLLDVTNPGAWMLHCHIAEHLEAGMHTVFKVLGRGHPTSAHSH